MKQTQSDSTREASSTGPVDKELARILGLWNMSRHDPWCSLRDDEAALLMSYLKLLGAVQRGHHIIANSELPYQHKLLMDGQSPLREGLNTRWWANITSCNTFINGRLRK